MVWKDGFLRMKSKLKIGVHKFTSCDGCQLAFLNLGEQLLLLAELVDIVHFPELGPVSPDEKMDVAYVEGSISTPEEIERIKRIRANTSYLITIGACATAGGIQALRNFSEADKWVKAIYATPQTLSTLKTAMPISHYVKVDFELWGCPVNGKQILDSLRAFLRKSKPYARRDSVCMECKKQGHVCVLVTKNEPCLGPVTQEGCGALCPALGRDCYACYGPAEKNNTASLAKQFQSIGLSSQAIARRFLFINNEAKSFKDQALLSRGKKES